MFYHVSKVILCDQRSTCTSFSKDKLHVRRTSSTLETSIVILHCRCSTSDVLCYVFLANRIVRAASSGDNVQIPWQAWHFVTCDGKWRKRCKHPFWSGRCVRFMRNSWENVDFVAANYKLVVLHFGPLLRPSIPPPAPSIPTLSPSPKATSTTAAAVIQPADRTVPPLAKPSLSTLTQGPSPFLTGPVVSRRSQWAAHSWGLQGQGWALNKLEQTAATWARLGSQQAWANSSYVEDQPVWANTAALPSYSFAHAGHHLGLGPGKWRSKATMKGQAASTLPQHCKNLDCVWPAWPRPPFLRPAEECGLSALVIKCNYIYCIRSTSTPLLSWRLLLLLLLRAWLPWLAPAFH